jgi:hypothetical protein
VTGLRAITPLAMLVACLPRTAQAQLGEVQLGPVLTYGRPAPYRLGAGLVLGLAAGRLAYVGLRWSYQTGSTHPETSGSVPLDVRTRAWLLMADLGVLIPVGALDVVPGGTLGVSRFAQRAGGPGAATQRSTELTGGPSLSVQAHLLGLVFTPELQYLWAGDPGLPWAVTHQGPVASLRIAVPFEVDRIRY